MILQKTAVISKKSSAKTRGLTFGGKRSASTATSIVEAEHEVSISDTTTAHKVAKITTNKERHLKFLLTFFEFVEFMVEILNTRDSEGQGGGQGHDDPYYQRIYYRSRIVFRVRQK
jgi:hypothetical protein